MKYKTIIGISLLVLFIFKIRIFGNVNEHGMNKGDNTIFIVMLISLIIWICLSIYIFYLNRKVRQLEKKVDDE